MQNQSIYLTNNELAQIEAFNAQRHGYSIHFAPRKQQFILKQHGKVIHHNQDVWSAIDYAFARDLNEIQRLA